MLKTVGSCACHLELPHTLKIHPVFHVSLLCLTPANPIPGQSNEPLALSLVKTQMKSSRLKKSLTPSQQCLDRSSSTWSNSLDGQLKMPLKSLLSILTTPKTPSTTSMRNTQGNHSHRTTPTSGLRLTGVCYVKEGGNVTVLAQLHIWHKSHTLLGSSICTVACLLCYCLVAYLAQVTHLAGKFYLHTPCREVPC